MAIPAQCSAMNNNKIIVLSENKSVFRFLNPAQNEVECIVVDGCVITEGIRCDHLLIDANGVEHFIELKGSDVKHALEQLGVSIQKLGKNVPRYAFVVSTRCPIAGGDIQMAQKVFKKKYRADLIIKKSPCEHSHS